MAFFLLFPGVTLGPQIVLYVGKGGNERGKSETHIAILHLTLFPKQQKGLL